MKVCFFLFCIKSLGFSFTWHHHHICYCTTKILDKYTDRIKMTPRKEQDIPVPPTEKKVKKKDPILSSLTGEQKDSLV
jgi:hypothetical protein